MRGASDISVALVLFPGCYYSLYFVMDVVMHHILPALMSSWQIKNNLIVNCKGAVSIIQRQDIVVMETRSKCSIFFSQLQPAGIMFLSLNNWCFFCLFINAVFFHGIQRMQKGVWCSGKHSKTCVWGTKGGSIAPCRIPGLGYDCGKNNNFLRLQL